MKNLTLLILLLSSLSLQAQFKKGMTMIGTSSNLSGNMGKLFENGIPNNVGIQFGSYSADLNSPLGKNSVKTKFSTFNFSPNVGIMASHNVLVGFSLGTFMHREKPEGEDKEGFTIFSFSSMVRYYAFNDAKVTPYGEAIVGLMTYKPIEENKNTATFLGLKGGAAIFITEHTSFEVFAHWTRSAYEQKVQGGSNLTTKQSLVGIGMGLSIFLPKRK